MAVTTGSQYHTLVAAADALAGITRVNAIWISVTTGSNQTVTLTADGNTIWSISMSAGDFAVLPFSKPQDIDTLTLSAVGDATLVCTVWVE